MGKFSTAWTISKEVVVMSAITETAPGGEMVCILGFEARPRDLDGRPIAGKRRPFSIGEHVRYVKSIYVDKPEDNPLGYMAIFEPLDAEGDDFYGAVQDYFVSLDRWEALKEHFSSESTDVRSGLSKQVDTTN
jgi:hypothetical protein